MQKSDLPFQWAIDGFRFDLEATHRPRTVEYYVDRVSRFAAWLKERGDQLNLRHLSKRDVQLFFHHIATAARSAVGGSGSVHTVQGHERQRWPYFRSLRRFFSWVTAEGLLDHNPMEGITMKEPPPPPIEPWRPHHISCFLKVLDWDWS